MASGGRVPSSATSISLHERFSNLRSSAGARNDKSPRAEILRQTTASLRKASSKNQRLALQMEQRTLANVALKLKKKSIKLRLGGNQPTFNTSVRNRGVISRRRAQSGRMPTRGTGTRGLSGTPSRIRNRGASVQRGVRGQMKRGGLSAGKITKRGTASGNVVQRSNRARSIGRGASPRSRPVSGNQSVRARGAVRTSRGPFHTNNNKRPARGQVPQRKASTRGGNVARGRGRGGRARGASRSNVSKEDLDKQLDQYMSGTKHTLDQELDSYMRVADVEMK